MQYFARETLAALLLMLAKQILTFKKLQSESVWLLCLKSDTNNLLIIKIVTNYLSVTQLMDQLFHV